MIKYVSYFLSIRLFDDSMFMLFPPSTKWPFSLRALNIFVMSATRSLTKWPLEGPLISVQYRVLPPGGSTSRVTCRICPEVWSMTYVSTTQNLLGIRFCSHSYMSGSSFSDMDWFLYVYTHNVWYFTTVHAQDCVGVTHEFRYTHVCPPVLVIVVHFKIKRFWGVDQWSSNAHEL